MQGYGKEELEAKVDSFLESYKIRFGSEPDLSAIHEDISKIIQERKEMELKSVFKGLDFGSLVQIARIIRERTE